jgi:hypothetical protein
LWHRQASFELPVGIAIQGHSYSCRLLRHLSSGLGGNPRHVRVTDVCKDRKHMTCPRNNPQKKSHRHQVHQQDEGLGDEIVAAGRNLDDDEFIEYIIPDIDEEYTSFVSAICMRTGPISLSEFYYHLLTFETHTDSFQDEYNRSVNSTMRGGFKAVVVLVAFLVDATPLQVVIPSVVEDAEDMVAATILGLRGTTMMGWSSAKFAARKITLQSCASINLMSPTSQNKSLLHLVQVPTMLTQIGMLTLEQPITLLAR